MGLYGIPIYVCILAYDVRVRLCLICSKRYSSKFNNWEHKLNENARNFKLPIIVYGLITLNREIVLIDPLQNKRQ